MTTLLTIIPYIFLALLAAGVVAAGVHGLRMFFRWLTYSIILRALHPHKSRRSLYLTRKLGE